MTNTRYTDVKSGTVYFPMVFPTTVCCHIGTAHSDGDLINLKNNTTSYVTYTIYERIYNGECIDNFDIIAIGY